MKEQYVIEVIPLSVLPPNTPQILSYYHDRELAKGAVVQVPLNRRDVTAVVIGSELIQSQKILLKKSGFALKKISKVVSLEPQVSEYQFKIALWLANEYVSPLGLSLRHVLPPFFGKKKYPTPRVEYKVPEKETEKARAILARAKESFKVLKPHLPTKNDGQTLIVVPEMSYIPFFSKQFPNCQAIHSGISNQISYDAWKKASEDKSTVIVGTRQALTLPFVNLKTLIVVDPLDEFYKSDMSPKYKAPELAKMVAELYGAKFITVSDILGVDDYQKGKEDKIEIENHLKPWPFELDVIDLVAEQKRGYVGIFSDDVKRDLNDALKNNKKVLIYAARRGHSGILVCQRCGYANQCPDCERPMRIHQGAEMMLMCHHDGATAAYPSSCKNCHSSQLKPIGPAGSQKIFEEIQKMFELGQLPRTTTLILDADVTQNQTEEDEVMETARKPGPVVLIATQKVFSYIFDNSFDYIVVPQLTALSPTADFQTNERLWYQLEKLADFEPELMSIQTYQSDVQIKAASEQNYSQLYDEDLKAREMFAYPPFSKIIKLTFSHPNLSRVRQETRLAISKFKMAVLHLGLKDQVIISESSPLFLKKEKGAYVYALVIKAKPNAERLREFLRFAPSHWLIDIDPRSIL
ncbi:MAG TPA: hypothetical protein VFK07_01755 [Candidatus Paceibacterota bacterium]|nr:hypothetical protein [Candidatus Paceibacterota bacterium]